MRYREESHETAPRPPPTVSRVSPKVFTQLCKADMFTCSCEFHSVITCFKDRIYQLKNKDKYAQSRLRGQVMYRFHKLHLVCSRAHFLDLYNRKLFCSLNLGVIREGTKSEKENKWTGRSFGSLRSKRFQSSYWAKVRAEAKKRLKGEGEGRRGNVRSPPLPPSFMFFLLLSQLSRRTLRGNACHAG